VPSNGLGAHRPVLLYMVSSLGGGWHTPYDHRSSLLTDKRDYGNLSGAEVPHISYHMIMKRGLQVPVPGSRAGLDPRIKAPNPAQPSAKRPLSRHVGNPARRGAIQGTKYSLSNPLRRNKERKKKSTDHSRWVEMWPVSCQLRRAYNGGGRSQLGHLRAENVPSASRDPGVFVPDAGLPLNVTLCGGVPAERERRRAMAACRKV
jgi:hypothetical protein